MPGKHVTAATCSCSRKTVSYFYIYSLHIVGGNGPIKEDPDPISAVASKERVILSICAFITLSEVIFEVIFYTVLGCRG